MQTEIKYGHSFICNPISLESVCDKSLEGYSGIAAHHRIRSDSVFPYTAVLNHIQRNLSTCVLAVILIKDKNGIMESWLCSNK